MYSQDFTIEVACMFVKNTNDVLIIKGMLDILERGFPEYTYEILDSRTDSNTSYELRGYNSENKVAMNFTVMNVDDKYYEVATKDVKKKGTIFEVDKIVECMEDTISAHLKYHDEVLKGLSQLKEMLSKV